jgi:hypothetical protein
VTFVADPEIAETIKRTNRPYFSREENVCALLAAEDHRAGGWRKRKARGEG